jgi:hypothetical protein
MDAICAKNYRPFVGDAISAGNFYPVVVGRNIYNLFTSQDAPLSIVAEAFVKDLNELGTVK